MTQAGSVEVEATVAEGSASDALCDAFNTAFDSASDVLSHEWW